MGKPSVVASSSGSEKTPRRGCGVHRKSRIAPRGVVELSQPRCESVATSSHLCHANARARDLLSGAALIAAP